MFLSDYRIVESLIHKRDAKLSRLRSSLPSFLILECESHTKARQCGALVCVVGEVRPCREGLAMLHCREGETLEAAGSTTASRVASTTDTWRIQKQGGKLPCRLAITHKKGIQSGLANEQAGRVRVRSTVPTSRSIGARS